MTATRWLLVGLGGFAGSVLRYALSTLVQGAARGAPFPFGTLAVNLLGCLAIGLLAELAEEHPAFDAERRALLFTGVLGGFTTFSAFGNETLDLLRRDQAGLAAANVLAQVGLGLVCVYLGRTLGRLVWRG
jgi:CrcB protein